MACVGAFYEKMGRMLGSSFPDTINNLLKALKSAEVCPFKSTTSKGVYYSESGVTYIPSLLCLI